MTNGEWYRPWFLHKKICESGKSINASEFFILGAYILVDIAPQKRTENLLKKSGKSTEPKLRKRSIAITL